MTEMLQEASIRQTLFGLTDGTDEPVETDDAFSYDGYQVVRGEFFAHLREPSIVFDRNRVSVNSACLKKLPDTEFIQILVNPETKKLAVRPCSEEEKDSFKWSTSGKKKLPRKIICKVFYAKVFSLMHWNPEFRYKLLGKLIQSNGELLFVFDLRTPSVFVKIEAGDGRTKFSRSPQYPEEWKNQFGVAFEEHQTSLQVNIFDGYAIFELTNDNDRKPASEPEGEVRTDE